jgi:SAM-dependent methyltransferase
VTSSSPSPATRSGVRYAIAIFLSSSLLFLLEPIAAKQLLPLLGGSAAVWTACLVFFQCALLLGYATAHWLAGLSRARVQASVYVGLLALSLVQLSIGIDARSHADPTHPIASVLVLLAILIGIPFVTLSATSPLLQAWYARATSTPPPGAADLPSQPYRLFAISNVGSLMALLVYPWLIEPRMTIHGQTSGLAIGFAVLALVCGVIAWSIGGTAGPAAVSPDAGDRPALPAMQLVTWISLAACGSVLLSAVTNHLSQNVATIPLLWIIPLVAYLLSFVVAFADDRWHPRWLVLILGAAGVTAAGYFLHRGTLTLPVAGAVAIFCASLFAICLFCHSELYRRRPEPARLTTFYICVAAGGALGAILVGVAAPTLLSGNYEFALGLAIAAVLGLLVTWKVGIQARVVSATAVVFLVWLVVHQVHGDRSLYRVRNFYGTLRVTQDSDESFFAFVRTLSNGGINHGQQVFRTDLDTTPTTYYGHPSGVGLAADLCCGQRPRRIGVIGLGTGTMAAYGRAGDTIRFYDINPAVEPIARGFFRYLGNSLAHVEIVNGDARVSMEHEQPQRYNLIVVDAFSGDAIPVHLITAQALELYRRHLAPGGIVAFHVSNRYLDLAPVVRRLADNAGLASAAISSEDASGHDLFSSDWVLVTADSEFLARPEFDKGREDITVPRGLRLWTDDYNSLLPILRMHGSSDE